MPYLTVALPMYRAKHIGWLAMESLCNQITKDFKWELVIAEEQGENNLYYGYNNIIAYEERLREVGCIDIKYIKLDEWMPLSKKWMLIKDNSSSDSNVFVLQAADCYSGPSRLQNTYNIFSQNNINWLQYTKHLIYDLASCNFYMLDIEGIGAPIGADMAIDIDILKKIKSINKKRRIDRWLYESCKKIKKNEFIVFNDRSSKWKDSLNVHGLNNISNRKNKIEKNIYTKVNNKIKNRFPNYVIKKLNECKQFTTSWSRIV